MAFWEDWEIDWQMMGIALGIWAVMGLILFKGLMFGDALESVKLLGMPSRWSITAAWIISLPIGYFWIMKQYGDG